MKIRVHGPHRGQVAAIAVHRIPATHVHINGRVVSRGKAFVDSVGILHINDWHIDNTPRPIEGTDAP